MLRLLILVVVVCAGFKLDASNSVYTGPIIDTHLHATPETSQTLKTSQNQLLDQMKQYNVLASVVSIAEPAQLNDWAEVKGATVLVGPSFPCTDGKYPRMNPCFSDSDGWPELSWLETEIKAGRITVFGELLYVYYGIAPSDERLMPYYRLAEHYNIPIAVHAAHGPPERGRAKGCCPNFNEAMGDPLLLVPVLKKFPKLKLWLMHAGEIKFHEQAIQLMQQYPNVYAEMSILNSVLPQEIHSKTLKGFINAGLEDRIMFGSDNVAFEKILKRMHETGHLTPELQRKTFYDNATRFFNLNRKIEKRANK